MSDTTPQQDTTASALRAFARSGSYTLRHHANDRLLIIGQGGVGKSGIFVTTDGRPFPTDFEAESWQFALDGDVADEVVDPEPETLFIVLGSNEHGWNVVSEGKIVNGHGDYDYRDEAQSAADILNCK